jgi:hypothetical protein
MVSRVLSPAVCGSSLALTSSKLDRLIERQVRWPLVLEGSSATRFDIPEFIMPRFDPAAASAAGE